MRARVTATALLAAGLLLGTTGCTFFTPQATLITYDASDGVSTDVGDVQIRNALLVVGTDGYASFVGAMINQGDTQANLILQYGANKTTKHVGLPAGSTLSFGERGARLILTDVRAKAGSLLPVYIQYGDKPGRKLLVPVLAGDFAPYSTIAPTPSATSEGTPIPAIPDSQGGQRPTGKPTPTPTQTAKPAGK